MFKRPVREINAEYQAEEKNLTSIQNLVKETCVNAGMSRKDTMSVILAIEEGVTNIIRHAYIYEKGIVRIRIVVFSKRIVFSLIDSGRSFQPDGDTKLDLEKLADSGRKGGLGFYMIKKIMDSVEYLSTPGFNEMRMTKLIKPQSELARSMMGRMFTLRVKFSVYTFLIMLTIIVGSYLFIDNRTTKSIHRQLHKMAGSLSETIADQAGVYISNNRSDAEFFELVESYDKANPELVAVVLTDSSNMVLAHSRTTDLLYKKYQPPAGISASLYGTPQYYDDPRGGQLIYLINPVSDFRGKTVGQVHFVYTGEMTDQMLQRERAKIIILTVIGLAFGIGGIYLLSDYFVSPIVRIVDRVRKFSSGAVETELPLEGAVEYFEISKVLNEMMSRLRRDHKNILERERVAKEIEVAAEIQKTLLPREIPEIPDMQIDSCYRAASHISGDLYDVYKIDKDNYCILVADVSGKGIPASLIMSVLRTVIRIQSRGKTSAHDILVAVNDYISDDITPGIFITIFLGIYNIKSSKLNFVSAGHNPLIYLNWERKEVSLFNPRGVPLGLPFDDEDAFAVKLKQQFIDIRNGDILFIYSDGITEAMDRHGAKFGMDRLVSIFAEDLINFEIDSPQQISEVVLSNIDSHCGLATQADDITFLSLLKKEFRPDSNDPNIESASLPE